MNFIREDKLFLQCCAKGFKNRKYDSAIFGIDGYILHKIEVSIWLKLIGRVQSIEVKNLNQGLVLKIYTRTRRHCGIINPGCIVSVNDPQLEIIGPNLGSSQVVDVLHLQIPGRQFGIDYGRTQEFQNHHIRLGSNGIIFLKFPDFVNDAIVAVLIGNTQHLIIAKCKIQGNISELLLHFKIFVLYKLARAFQKFIINTSLQTHAFKHGFGIVTTQKRRTFSEHSLVKAIAVIVGWIVCSDPCFFPVAAVWTRFSKIKKWNDIPKRLRIPGAVGYINLHTGNVESGSNLWYGFECFLVIVSELLTEEKVLVCLVLVTSHLKFPGRYTAFQLQPACFTPLVGGNCSHLQLSELHGGFHPKQVLCTGNQCRAEWHTHISGLQFLNDFVVLS